MFYQKIYDELLAHTPGVDISRPGIGHHAAEAWQFLTAGYQADLQEIIKGSTFICAYEGIVILRDIPFISLCEHHLLPIMGHCHIAYIPEGRILGIGTLEKIVNVFSRRLQLQERLTMQIAESVLAAVQAQGAGVMIAAKHLCRVIEGVEKADQIFETSCFLGSLKQEGRRVFYKTE